MTQSTNKTKININGKTIYAESNQTILQACEKIGLYIPRFCYNEALSIAGNCRMCLVEIEKSPKLMPACAIKIANDMKINTKTNLVKKTRESILEFLLINHPLDCPICDQGGECDLQDQAMVYGSDRGRFYEYKRSVQDKNAGPLIKTIMTRCIHCTRCIRYATEIAGVEVYGTTGRGKSMEVGTYITNLFNSEISGNVIDLCPVGALTSKPYAFTVRPWELKSIESIDIFDALGSNIRIDLRGTELMRILPKPNNKINQQWISDKIRFGHDGLKSQRLYYPLLKQNKTIKKNFFDNQESESSKKFLTISWKKAFEIIKNEINKKIINKKIGGIIGHFTEKETILILKKLLNQLGINNFYYEQTGSFIKNKTNINFDFRSKYLSDLNLDENNNYDTIFLVGTNPRYEASMLNIHLRQTIIKNKNKNINVINLGNPVNLTYKTQHIGNNIENLYEILKGKSIYTKIIYKSKNILNLVAYNQIERKDGKTIYFLLKKILNYKKKIDEKNQIKNIRQLHNITKKNRNSIIDIPNEKDINKKMHWRASVPNILHTNVSIPGALDLGFNSNKALKKEELDLLYIIGADLKTNFLKNLKTNQQKQTFIIYQGHHGCNTAKFANIILPSYAPLEKISTYMNTEGIIQQSQNILNCDYDIYEDWEILQLLANELNIPGLKEIRYTNENIPLNKYNNVINLNSKKNIGTKYIKNQKVLKQIILNNLFDKINSLYLTNNLNIKKKQIISNQKNILSQNNIKLNKIFENITPNVKTYIDIKKSRSSIKPQKNFKKILKNKITEYHILYKSNIIHDRDNFYLTDIITRSSKTMGKCSALFKTENFIN